MRQRKSNREEFSRSFTLEDIEVMRSGDGRTVRAYASTFASAYEVQDVHGHYFETINRSAFDRFLERPIAGRVQCLFNHGTTLHGTPSERFSLPLGTPLEVSPDAKGLVTVTRYAQTDTADEVLELIRSGAIVAQSFRGPIFASARPVPHRDGLSLIERTDLGIRDYGPTPYAVNNDAGILSVRSSEFTAEEITNAAPDERLELLRSLAEKRGIVLGNLDGTPPPKTPPAPPLRLLELEQERRRRVA